MEATVEKYKRRLEDMAELRQQVKELDDLNSKYLDQMLKLESTAKTIPTLTMKIEQYKNQVMQTRVTVVSPDGSAAAPHRPIGAERGGQRERKRDHVG